MLKELYMALRMCQAVRNIQSEIGPLKAIYSEDEEDKSISYMACGENKHVYLNTDCLSDRHYDIYEDTRIVWNYCVSRNVMDRETFVDADGVECEIDSVKVCDVWFVYIER